MLKPSMRQACDSLIENEAGFHPMITLIDKLLTSYVPLVDLVYAAMTLAQGSHQILGARSTSLFP